MKAEEKTVAFMFFSVVMQFVYSLGEKTETKHKNNPPPPKKKKKNTEFGGGGGCGG